VNKAQAAASRRSRKRSSRKAAVRPLKGPKTKKKAAGAPRAKAAPKHPDTKRPIELYYWPTPNGWKISIMLEECKLPYELKPVNIGRGEQFKPEFLKISPNNRMPAIVDPDGPGGKPISVFESGAILQYLGRKTGKFYPADERKRVAVDEWLFWQVGGLGPMAGQNGHFRNYAPEPKDYAVKRYTDEVNRLFGVMNKQLATRKYLAGDYSIADMACWGWVVPWERQGQNIDEFPHLKAWLGRMRARPAVQKGFALGAELRQAQANGPKAQEEARKVLFGQRART
jgi:GST-like protein